jgi:hypothetical protein
VPDDIPLGSGQVDLVLSDVLGTLRVQEGEGMAFARVQDGAQR